MPDQMRSKIQLVIHGELQVLFVSIAGPVATDLDKLPRNANLKGSSGPPPLLKECPVKEEASGKPADLRTARKVSMKIEPVRHLDFLL